MLNTLNWFKSKDPDVSVVPERKIYPDYILDEKNREEYMKYGYTIIRNAVPNEAIEEVFKTFEIIKNLPDYFESDHLQTTIAFGEEAHNIAINTIKKISPSIFKGVLDETRCQYDFGGGLIIKNKGCWFAPHQDCSIIDEYESTTSYAWIPTEDMTENNGTFFAIPGSHLWSAWQRSSQYPSWPLKSFSKFLWKQMEPIQVNKGDLLLFDSALIHASGSNKTGRIRLAFNVCIIDRAAEHVQYVYESDTPKGKVEKYVVDEEFWFKGNLWGRPEGYPLVVEDVRYPQRISKSFLLQLIKKFHPRN